MPDFSWQRNHVDICEAATMEASSFSRRTPGQAYDFLPPEPANRQYRSARPADISDAEFVTLGKVRPREFSARTYNDNRKRMAAAQAAQPPLMPAMAASVLRTVESWLQRASMRSFAALVLALVVLVFGLAGGFSGLSGERATSGAPLHFTHVTVTPRDANGMRVLVINGIIENESGTTQTVHPIRADLVTDERLTASIVINPPADVIYSGQSRGFSARVQHAGGKMPEVRLSFLP
ncbi:Membrane protein [Rhizobium leguminosarum]|uniref:Membrane protein n=2 Tax=Rhizobium leguminosarum TaxID=384 RepID=A0A2K9Z8U1_RHILE|nr:Membrane protein [Rhizobium leguminosarum]